MSAFMAYWTLFGLPLSRFKGRIVDSVPFPVVEGLLWFGGLATLAWLLSWIRIGRRIRAARIVSLVFGPILLLVLAAGQGTLPVGIDPTAWRTPLSRALGADSLSRDVFQSWVAERGERLLEEFDWERYEALSEREMLVTSDRSLDGVLADLGLPRGRTVRAVKEMGPLTTTFALAYGGPAYHDPLTEEIGIARPEDYPTPREWRLIAICHEAAHAKGFSREMDAEILTQLALLRIPDPRFRALADIHFLQKTGVRVQWPDSLTAEFQRSREERLAVERRQGVVSFLKHIGERTHVGNTSGKYGTRTRDQVWDPRQPFFATVRRWERQVAATPAGRG